MIKKIDGLSTNGHTAQTFAIADILDRKPQIRHNLITMLAELNRPGVSKKEEFERKKSLAIFLADIMRQYA